MSMPWRHHRTFEHLTFRAHMRLLKLDQSDIFRAFDWGEEAVHQRRYFTINRVRACDWKNLVPYGKAFGAVEVGRWHVGNIVNENWCSPIGITCDTCLKLVLDTMTPILRESRMPQTKLLKADPQHPLALLRQDIYICRNRWTFLLRDRRLFSYHDWEHHLWTRSLGRHQAKKIMAKIDPDLRVVFDALGTEKFLDMPETKR